MFTGLVQAVGLLQIQNDTTVKIRCSGDRAPLILTDLEIGDSVAVDGICLTVEQLLPQGFIATVSPETLNRTTLGRYTDTATVNLETSLRVGSKLGGHFVTGHVDGIGHLENAIETNDAWELTFTVASAPVSRYLVPKGSIAVNGISLTVADCDAAGRWFTVAVIPHTYSETNLSKLQSGDRVNLEGDILGKYVEKFTQLGSLNSSDLGALEEGRSANGLTAAFLLENGYS